MEIQEIHGQSRHRYGYRRIHACLVSKSLQAGRNSVQCRVYARIRSCHVKTKGKAQSIYHWHKTVILSDMNVADLASNETFNQQLKM